ELLKQVARNAARPQIPVKVVAPDLTARAEIPKRIAELGSEAYSERFLAFHWLMAFGETPGALGVLRQELQQAVETRYDPEVVKQVQGILSHFKKWEDEK